MPLKPGSSSAVKSANIRELMRTGKYPRKQAIAIALDKARKYADGGRTAGLGRSIGPAPKSEKLVGEFRDPLERAGGIPWLISYGTNPKNIDRTLGARRRRDPNEELPGNWIGPVTAGLADGGSVIDDLRESLEMRAADQAEPSAEKGLTTVHDIASATPVIGNAMAASDAYLSGRDALAALRRGDWRRAAIESGISGASAAGALSPVPWSARAGRVAREARDTANVLVPALEGPATSRARDMRAEGKQLQDIWKETHRTPSPDGSIRREIRDDTMTVNPDLRAGDLMEVRDAVRHPALFNSYPHLAERPFRVTSEYDSLGKPVVRTAPSGDFEVNPNSGDLRSRLAKLFQYEVSKDHGALAIPLRHGADALERGIDNARFAADKLDPVDRRSVDAYLNNLAEIRDNYALRREHENYIRQGARSDAAFKIGQANAGNLEAHIASMRARATPEDLKSWPYRRKADYIRGPGNPTPTAFADAYVLPPADLQGKDLQDFIDRWHQFGSGRGKFARGGRVQRALKRAKVVTGGVRGKTAGRSDKLPVNVPAGAYVIPAAVVSALGDGNTEAGMHVLDRKFGGKLSRKSGGRVQRVPILISDGEYVLSPTAVARAGGHDALDALVTRTRHAYAEHLRNLPAPNK